MTSRAAWRCALLAQHRTFSAGHEWVQLAGNALQPHDATAVPARGFCQFTSLCTFTNTSKAHPLLCRGFAASSQLPGASAQVGACSPSMPVTICVAHARDQTEAAMLPRAGRQERAGGCTGRSCSYRRAWLPFWAPGRSVATAGRWSRSSSARPASGCGGRPHSVACSICSQFACNPLRACAESLGNSDFAEPACKSLWPLAQCLHEVRACIVY